MTMFDFDPAKDELTRASRGFGFVFAARIFAGHTVERVDRRFDYGEERIVALGRVGEDTLAVVYTWRKAEKMGHRYGGSSPRDWQTARKGRSMPRFSLDDAMRAEPDDRARMDVTTEDDIQHQIADDLDTAPDLGGEDPAGFVVRRSYPDLKRLRQRLGMSQTEFAHAYGLSVWTLRQWEQGIAEPDGAARSYLKVIDQDPEGTRRALAKAS